MPRLSCVSNLDLVVPATPGLSRRGELPTGEGSGWGGGVPLLKKYSSPVLKNDVQCERLGKKA